MPRNHFAALCLTIALSAPLYANAQEATYALGRTDFSDTGRDGTVFQFEYRFQPFSIRRVASFAWAASGAITERGDAFVGAGIWTRWQWQSGWFIDMSTMPGFYRDGDDANDLGSTFLFRSLVGVGYTFDNGNAISLAVTHKSNAGLASDNPGVNTYDIRFHHRF